MFFQKINERDSRFWPIWGDDSTPAVLVSYKGLLTTDPFPLNHSVQMSTQTFIHGMTKIRSSLSVKSFLCPGTLADRWTAFTTKVFSDPAGNYFVSSLPWQCSWFSWFLLHIPASQARGTCLLRWICHSFFAQIFSLSISHTALWQERSLIKWCGFTRL